MDRWVVEKLKRHKGKYKYVVVFEGNETDCINYIGRNVNLVSELRLRRRCEYE